MKEKIIVFGIVAMFLLIGVATLSPSGKETAKYKYLAVPSSYPTIQAAIDNASDDSDIITVAPGIYYENIKIDLHVRMLTIIGGWPGEPSPKATIIDGGGSGNVVSIIGRTWGVRIEKFTIRNGDVGVAFIGDATGVPTYNEIRRSIISNNGIGIKIAIDTNSNLIELNDFKDNSQNAYDQTDKNHWDSWDANHPSWNHGNYWDDYTGVDRNGDGIGDTPYNIPGGNDQDRYPFMQPQFLNDNVAPFTPSITGPAKIKAGKTYNYDFTAIDPDDDNVYYFIDWRDGTNSEWIGPYASEDKITESHTWSWSKKETYKIKAKVKDTHGLESDWATLAVTMQRNRAYINSPFLNFIENYLNQFPLLQKILQRIGQ